MFMNFNSAWASYRRQADFAELSDIMLELREAEQSLTNALSFGSRGRGKLTYRDRHTLVELIDEIRNYIDHIEEVY